MTDIEIGTKVLKYFWNWNRIFYPKVFNFTFDEFLSSYGKKINIYLDGIGGGVREAGVSDSKIDAAMNALALSSAGKIPSDYQVYFKYIQNEAVKVNWIDAASFTISESGKTILGGFEDLGNQLIFTGKILNFLLPAIALVVIYFLLNKNTEGQFSKAVRGLKK